MKSKSLILSTGLAMFSMFFGSGNLVFPLVVGQMSEGHYMLSAFGILLTGVLVPFLGILAVLLFKGNSKDFFALLGKYAPFWLSLICLSIMGPFGVLARCITVAHGAFQLLLPNTQLWVFSLVGCAIIFLLTIKKSKIVPMLGSILTPVLLVTLAAIAFFGLSSNEWPAAGTLGSWSSFKVGIFQGYQTMDLLAAFFFSTFVIRHLENKTAQPVSVFFRSSLIGAGLLSLVYFVLVLMGAMYAPELASIPPQEMLGYVAQRALGPLAAPIVCASVILACLTTAVVLASLFADFFKKEITKEKFSDSAALFCTLAFAFFTSTLEFSGIARIIGPILEILYPALITLALLGIFHKLWGWKSIRMPFAATLTLKLITSFA
ncbi:MAG: branched-chain amino acid transport system II carrier protein [Verrucomicrobia bacterium]|nr:branched-chain amino acid transport system II carrier protein [Verrucomicrobiota bacterium]